ncbi:hypothetical protein BGZ60DRAFT_363637 [Tricladium varicosporioides]|nr:hypothetical protein BGZ60DRAFT_363637 [Hymenoscyphus varicosporioides]
MSWLTPSTPSPLYLLESLFNHVALPPRLPDRQDNRLDQVQTALIDRLITASIGLRDCTQERYGQEWDTIRRSLQSCKLVNSRGKLTKTSLLTAFKGLQHNDMLILQVSEQNAALLLQPIRDATGQGVLFEAFETSPLAENVLASQGALEWDFPGSAVIVPLVTFQDHSFQEQLASFLTQASSESVKIFAATTTKAGSFTFESRDTVNPALITSMLMTILEANGTRKTPTILRKRIHDDVQWADGAENPWRRCPFWLIMRVAIHRHLASLFDGEVARLNYKFFMCQFIATLLEELTYQHFDPQLLFFLQSKLCRRLAKLETDKDISTLTVRKIYEYNFSCLAPYITGCIQKSSSFITTEWEMFKRNNFRPVIKLPYKADEEHKFLSLPNSSRYLQKVLMEFEGNPEKSKALAVQPRPSNVCLSSIKQLGHEFVSRYFMLEELEANIEKGNTCQLASNELPERQCAEVAKTIEKYMKAVSQAYDGNPEQMSMMLLTLMELWCRMDRSAIKTFPLLRQFNPGFPADIMDTLLVAQYADMCRLQSIRSYLRERHDESEGTQITIFHDPTKGCFAERWYNEASNPTIFHQLHNDIVQQASKAARDKEDDWREKCIEYEDLLRQIAESSCVFETDEFLNKVHMTKQCTKCFLERKAYRFRINVHEHPLPSANVQAKVVIFELACPKVFALYRETTWKIIGSFALLAPPDRREPCLLLSDYSELQTFVSTRSTFTLASTTKSFLSTHYRNPRFPVALDNVCLPNGLKYAYFDTLLRAWPGRELQKPTFSHHVRLNIPPSSPLSMSTPSDWASNSVGPSSNAIIASQAKSPGGMNVHEFVAFQTLFSGKARRWPQILMALGSNLLNFSAEATTRSIWHLALQSGPELNANPTGLVHRVFRDDSFCQQFLNQIGQRLDGISTSWREANCMDTIITLVLRIATLRPEIAEAMRLLQQARAATINWIQVLRLELQNATDADSSHSLSKHAFLVALLCRRTFSVYIDNSLTMDADALQHYIECSIALQDNIASNPASLPNTLQHALVRDMKMAYRLRHILLRCLQNNARVFLSSVTSVWPDIEGARPRRLLHIKRLSGSEEWWIEMAVASTAQTRQQTIHFHLLEGRLLVEYKPLGKLPAKYRKSAILDELFSNQSLLAYPSNLPGMEHALAAPVRGHQVHLAFQNDQVVVRVLHGRSIFQLIPREKFRGSRTFDLPSSLINDCFHFLDLNTGVIEIRPRSSIWKPKESNWVLDFHKRGARRRRVSLIAPESRIFQAISQMFLFFEYSHNLTVFQPDSGTLSVELRRLELTFHVNQRNLLECPQLRAEIDPDQDCGTWYGLQSKIVLRQITQGWHSVPQRRRYIIVPLGDISYRRHDVHVGVHISNSGNYAKFAINEILGRIDTPAEPRLLYTKAKLHAYTSFVLPDRLTKRTGVEESIDFLESSLCQPWKPLTARPISILLAIAHLSPSREYYPKGMKRMQKVFWDPNIPTMIQHDGYKKVVEGILEKSKLLSSFDSEEAKKAHPTLTPSCAPELEARSLLRRQTHDMGGDTKDATYHARDKWNKTQEKVNVFECSTLIRNWRDKLSTTSDLAGIMQSWATTTSPVMGFVGVFERILISDHLNVTFAAEWGLLVNLCLRSSYKDRYRLMFVFAPIVFRHDVDMAVVKTLIAFAILDDLKKLIPPTWHQYSQFRSNQIPSVTYLQQLMKQSLVKYNSEFSSDLGFYLTSKQRRKDEGARKAHELQQEQDTHTFAEFLLAQWPCAEPSLAGFSTPGLIVVDQAFNIIVPEWLRLFQNLQLSDYIHQVQCILNKHHSSGTVVLPNLEILEQVLLPIRCHGGEVPTLMQLMSKVGPSVKTMQPPCLLRIQMVNSSETDREDRKRLNEGYAAVSKRNFTQPEHAELQVIIDNFLKSDSAVRQQYGRDLQESLHALSDLRIVPREYSLVDQNRLLAEIKNTQSSINSCFSHLWNALSINDSRALWLQLGGLWPRVTPITLLEYLRSGISKAIFGSRMRDCIVNFGLLITHLQQLTRIESALQKGNHQLVIDEQTNEPHQNWSPHEESDLLLLEIDANILIRAGQIDVMEATVSPQSSSNSVLQMVMGAGKTSVILPMSAVTIANKRNICRIIVPKPLLFQTAQLLQERVGGLIGREILHLPWSRKTSTHLVKQYGELHQSIQKSSGIIIALPEHMLSFRLSGLQRLSDGHDASSMISVQSWFDRKARDIIDEVDYILAIRTQLIYPSGTQRTVDGHPHRWETIEKVLKMVDSHLWTLEKRFPRSIEVVRRAQGGFPVIYFLRSDVEGALVALLAEDIYQGHGSLLPEDCCRADRKVIKCFISEPKITADIALKINQLYLDRPITRQIIMLLRGLLVNRILVMTLRRRANVQYGLHPNRPPLAVPFYAKGMPSEQAEFGHPDSALLFTILAFYFVGVTEKQLQECLEYVGKSEDPAQVYDSFSHCANLPESLSDWAAVNIDDEGQLHDIWNHLRYQIPVINYFLNHHVFPRHAKTFELKLQTSGWDLPQFSALPIKSQSSNASSSLTRALTTGFSGTQDYKRLLPLTIKQNDLPVLSHTNAEVLSYFLQQRNREYVLAADHRGKRISEADLLRLITRMRLRVFIDAGAAILEMNNTELAKAWLEIYSDAPAVIYFRDQTCMVRYRRGHEIPLLVSPYADDLSDALVYIDEAHTRGTDLKIPPYSRGALTLGINLTKDAAVQAAMRLRGLGSSQSIVFISPPEVHHSLLDLRGKDPGDRIDSHDVLHWLLEQTCNGVEQLQPLYFSQGADFCRRAQAMVDNNSFLIDSSHREKYLSILRQYESQTLEQLYGPKHKAKAVISPGSLTPQIAAFMKELNNQRKSFQDTGIAVHSSALIEVELEREVAHEVENVREVQKPMHYPPLTFSGLHRDILTFFKTGRLVADSVAYENAFTALRKTCLGRKYGVRHEGTTGKLYVSTEFMRTVKFPTDRHADNFQRPVNWIMWSPINEIAMILVPEEVEQLLPRVPRNVSSAATYILTYAAPTTRKMLHFNNLKYWSTPPLPADWQPPLWLKVELGVFAGRTYFEYDEYSYLCAFLGLKEKLGALEEYENAVAINEDATEDSGAAEKKGEECQDDTQTKPVVFVRKPLTFLHEWLAIKRKNLDFQNTPVGYLCMGKSLTMDHSFFAKPEPSAPKDTAQVRGTSSWKKSKDEDEVEEDFYDENDVYDVEFEKDSFDDEQLLADLAKAEEKSNGEYDAAGFGTEASTK